MGLTDNMTGNITYNMTSNVPNASGATNIFPPMPDFANLTVMTYRTRHITTKEAVWPADLARSVLAAQLVLALLALALMLPEAFATSWLPGKEASMAVAAVLSASAEPS